ncbi:hypothetical protein SK128_027815, partial [Halocaridina rubra]
MTVTTEAEEGLVEEGAHAVVVPPKTPPPDYASLYTEAEAASADVLGIENGHIQMVETTEQTIAEKVAMQQNYDVPAHVLAFVPPDGGCRAWLVMIASFACNGIIFGIINSSGLIYDKLLERLQDEGDSNAAFKA